MPIRQRIKTILILKSKEFSKSNVLAKMIDSVGIIITIVNTVSRITFYELREHSEKRLDDCSTKYGLTDLARVSTLRM